MSRANNIDLLRVILSFSVVYYHYVFLTGNEISLGFFFNIIDSDVAVKSFFFLSGFLIWNSMQRSDSIRSFIIARMLRLFPALLIILLITCLWALLLEPGAFLESFYYYLWNAALLGFMHTTISQVTSETNINALNGSLWTLKVEFMYYIFIAAMFFIKKSKALKIVVFLTLISLLLNISVEFLKFNLSKSIVNQIPFVFCYFGLGVILFEMRDYYSRAGLNVAFLLSFLLYLFLPDVLIVRLLFVSFFVLWFSFGLPQIVSLDKVGDVSYGMYIIHFPLLQLSIASGYPFAEGLVAFFVFVFVLVFLSLCSWKFIESPSIKFGKKLVRRCI
ncbi:MULTISPECIES: acyltransferase family protein [unclassified Vibrio]|uniref:acyltransferase family protein n=1 Tax=unclassified Vibrio TaxID=2614977 RepID=UPI00354B34A1